MKRIKISYQQNKLLSETTSDTKYSGRQEGFSIRLIFAGHEQYTIENKHLSLYPGNFMVINHGTVFSRSIYSHLPANIFAVTFDSGFLGNFHQQILKTDECLLEDPFVTGKTNPPSFLETIYAFKGDMMFNVMHLVNHFQYEIADALLM